MLKLNILRMKKILFLLIAIPGLILAQNSDAHLVIENVMLTVDPEHVSEFEAGMAAHNKKYHADEVYGARVYWISNGVNSGKYMWNMGPIPWAAFDSRPAQDGHDEDWNKNVIKYVEAEGEVNYWRFHPDRSNFSKDFDLKNLLVFIVDVKRFRDMEFISAVEKVQKVYKEKRADQMYGVYTNEMANMQGNDFAWVDFFDKSSWMGESDTFWQDFEAVHGEGSMAKFMKSIEASTDGERHELWIYREDLSGLSSRVVAATRQ
jgi:hypothetical protein